MLFSANKPKALSTTVDGAFLFGLSCGLSSFLLLQLFSYGLTFVPALLVLLTGAFLVVGTRRTEMLLTFQRGDLILIGFYLAFLLIPFFAFALRNGGNPVHSPINLLDFAFRLAYFVLLIFVHRNCNSKMFWKGFLVPYALAAVVALAIGLNLISEGASFVEAMSLHSGNSRGLVLWLAFLFLWRSRLKSAASFTFFVCFFLTVAVTWFLFQAHACAIATVGALLLYLVIKRSSLALKKTLVCCLLIALAGLVGQALFLERPHLEGLLNNRAQIWKGYVEYSKPFFLLGIGHTSLRPDQKVAMTIADPLAREGASIGGVHNTYLFVYFTKGLLGLVLFLTIIYWVFIKNIHRRSDFNMLLLLFLLSYIVSTQGGFGGLEFSANVFLVTLLVDYRSSIPFKLFNLQRLPIMTGGRTKIVWAERPVEEV